jgi:hypothetical protein
MAAHGTARVDALADPRERDGRAVDVHAERATRRHVVRAGDAHGADVAHISSLRT